MNPTGHAAREAALPDADAIYARARHENFPVAMRMLPVRVRRPLRALYGFARLADELGDEWRPDPTGGAARDGTGRSGARAGHGTGERAPAPPEESVTAARLDALDRLERELRRVFAGEPGSVHPVLRALAPVVREHALPIDPFLHLIEANRRDQSVRRYERFEELRGYCALSADPVGRLVLGVFDVATPERVEWSDAVCSGLQLAEHWQDVAEDAARDRIYLPQEDLRRFGVAEGLLRSEHAAPALRALLRFEVARARQLLTAGGPLCASLRGAARLAVAGFVAGGRAALDAIERVDFDVLPGAPRPRRRDLLRHLLPLLVSSGAAPAASGRARVA